jgi:cell division protein FtsL
LRVEKLAKEQLQMRTVTPAITHYASYAGAASAAQRAADSASAPGASAVAGRVQ